MTNDPLAIEAFGEGSHEFKIATGARHRSQLKGTHGRRQMFSGRGTVPAPAVNANQVSPPAHKPRNQFAWQISCLNDPITCPEADLTR